MLAGLATARQLADAFAVHGGCWGFPTDPAAWQALRHRPQAAARLDRVLADATARLEQPWPQLPASLYLDYARTGNRVRYEKPYFERRERVGQHAIAWAVTGDTRWIEGVADGLWLICDERSWCIPAHAAHDSQPWTRRDLPDEDRIESLDLFACETALVLAEVCQLAPDALDAVHPAIRRRVRSEIRRRIVEPLLAGWQPGWFRMANNWVPWCSASVAGAAAWVLADRPADWGRLMHLLLGHCDRFVAGYGEDGGCDEGVGYWVVAAGALVRFLEEVSQRTGGSIDAVWQEPKLRNMVRFPARCHLGGGWYPSFADGPPRPGCSVAIPWRAAQRLGDRQLAAWAAFQAERDRPEAQGIVGDLFSRTLRRLWWFDAEAEVGAEPALADDWLPDLQVMIAHAGHLTLTAKAGHNDENHNHNDVGQLEVFHRGRPVLVDVGRGEYTAQTFGAQRYGLWWTRASGHAVPIVDGIEQAPGRQHAARAVQHRADERQVALAMDLSACYPRAGLTVERRIDLDRTAPAVQLVDTIAGAADYVLPLHFACEPVVDGDGWRAGGLRLTAPGLAGTVERVDLSQEPVMAKSWPDGLWRLTLRRALSGRSEIAITLHPA